MLEESSTYHELIARGETKGVRRKFVSLVRHRLGEVPEPLPGQLEALDLATLDVLFDKVLEAPDAAAIEALLASLE